MFGKACFLASLIPVVASASGAVPGQSTTYEVSIRHIQRSTLTVDDHRGLELELTLTNRSPHDLYDLRLFLERVGPLDALAAPDPARVRSLKSGEHTSVTWTYEGMLPGLANWKDATFRIEAVDASTQRRVTFFQHSTQGK